jgi:outer membrane protein assembly factor BamB
MKIQHAFSMTIRPALMAGLFTLSPLSALAQDGSVLTYHGDNGRSGQYVVPTLSWEKARTLQLDHAFNAPVAGSIYAQPLYWRPSGANTGMLFVATENDVVYALDATTGKELWKRTVGRPVQASSLPCGNINPLGITGTPVIDPATQGL